MTTLAINDLAVSKELDREAMRSHLGGRGLGRSALFAFFLPNAANSGLGGSGSFVLNQFIDRSSVTNNINNTLNQVFVDTLQFNQLNQIVDITDSPNAVVDQFGNTQNSNFKALGFAAA